MLPALLAAAMDHALSNQKKYFMKQLLSFLLHPLFLVLLFCCVIISGQSIGGFYIWYIMLGLPHGVLHSILGLTGIILVLTGTIKKSSILYLAGPLLMVASLMRFFLQPGGSYNYQTFYQPIPLLLLIFFGTVSLTFIVQNLFVVLRERRDV